MSQLLSCFPSMPLCNNPIPLYYFIPTSLHIPFPLYPLTVEVSSKSEQPSRLIQQTPIELEVEDLLEAGYDIKKRLWSAEEDQILVNLVENQKVSWQQIQQHMPNRTEKMCYSRYRRLLQEAKRGWLQKQDDKLRQLVKEMGQNWRSFLPHFSNRTWRQLRQRYTNYLRPDIKRDQWDLEEDLKIIELVKTHGTRWKLIEKQIGHRTQNQIKNRYYGRLKVLLSKKMKQLRKNKKTNYSIQ